jgi:hypothetical protein
MPEQYTTEAPKVQTPEEWPYGYGICKCGCGQPTTIAPRTYGRLHVKKGEPMQFVTGHNTHRPDNDRFWKMVDRSRGPDACWIWTGGRLKTGYGSMGIYHGGDMLAHRFSWILHNGPIPDGLCVCHNCPGGDNTSCVNPAHLFLGTHEDNMQDASKKGRLHPAKGEQAWNAKLTATDICAIRDAASNGTQQQVLARIYGVSKPCISNIVHRKRWKHIL